VVENLIHIVGVRIK